MVGLFLFLFCAHAWSKALPHIVIVHTPSTRLLANRIAAELAISGFAVRPLLETDRFPVPTAAVDNWSARVVCGRTAGQLLVTIGSTQDAQTYRVAVPTDAEFPEATAALRLAELLRTLLLDSEPSPKKAPTQKVIPAQNQNRDTPPSAPFHRIKILASAGPLWATNRVTPGLSALIQGVRHLTGPVHFYAAGLIPILPNRLTNIANAAIKTGLFEAGLGLSQKRGKLGWRADVGFALFVFSAKTESIDRVQTKSGRHLTPGMMGHLGGTWAITPNVGIALLGLVGASFKRVTYTMDQQAIASFGVPVLGLQAGVEVFF